MDISAVRRFALSLPETTEAPHFKATSFRVRGKIFATAPPGDDVLHVFVDEEQREAALAMHPAFLEKLFWGKKVWGLRVLLAKARPKVVEQLLAQAWKDKAPKTLLATPGASAAKTSTKKPAKSSAKNKTTQTDASVDAWLATIKEPSRRDDCKAIVDLMASATGEDARMWGTGIVGFGTRHYRYESGREGDTCVLGFASRKEAIALYLCGGLDPHAERLKKLGKHKTGKGCLYIGKLADVDRKILHELLRVAAMQAT